VGGPFWQVLKGRKDGRVSSAALVPGNLPQPTQSLDELTAVFARKGFTRDEMVILSGPKPYSLCLLAIVTSITIR
jgi:peroxidase